MASDHHETKPETKADPVNQQNLECTSHPEFTHKKCRSRSTKMKMKNHLMVRNEERDERRRAVNHHEKEKVELCPKTSRM